MRWLLIALAVSGCGFSIDTEGPIVGGDDQPGTEPDATTVTPRMCSTSDPSLKLCIDFDDAANPATDQRGHTVIAKNITPMARDNELAVDVDMTSELFVPETPDLDIPDNLTVSMWIKFGLDGLPVSAINSRWLYDNNTQYFASLRVGGVIRCGSGTVDADSVPVPADSQWHHIACAYQKNEIRVYVDGHVSGCDDISNRLLPTNGHDGFAIGANVAGGAGAPNFSEEFIGGIDNVQVFSRLVSPEEICHAAGKSQCLATCP